MLERVQVEFRFSKEVSSYLGDITEREHRKAIYETKRLSDQVYELRSPTEPTLYFMPDNCIALFRKDREWYFYCFTVFNEWSMQHEEKMMVEKTHFQRCRDLVEIAIVNHALLSD